MKTTLVEGNTILFMLSNGAASCCLRDGEVGTGGVDGLVSAATEGAGRPLSDGNAKLEALVLQVVQASLNLCRGASLVDVIVDILESWLGHRVREVLRTRGMEVSYDNEAAVVAETSLTRLVTTSGGTQELIQGKGPSMRDTCY